MNELSTIIFKTCLGCQQYRTQDSFSRDKWRNDGLRRYCRECDSLKRTARSVQRRSELPTVEAKACSKCKLVKLVSEFSRDKYTPDGLGYMCKVCLCATQRARSQHPKKINHLTDAEMAVSAKTCRKCETEKAGNQFYRSTRNLDGLASYCIDCANQKTHASKRKRPDREIPDLAAVSRRCPRCFTVKRGDEFYFEKRNGFSGWCKGCLGDYDKAMRLVGDGKDDKGRRQGYLLIRRYGITVEEYDRILNEQGGSCKICGDSKGDRAERKLHVDHNHDTGVVRGLLCSKCNTAIGSFQDDPELCIKAAEYLKATRAAEEPTLELVDANPI